MIDIDEELLFQRWEFKKNDLVCQWNFRAAQYHEALAARFYRRYGVWSLLFSWLPVIGDPLCLAGGILKGGFGRFSLLELFVRL